MSTPKDSCSGLSPADFLKQFNKMSHDFSKAEQNLQFVQNSNSSKLTLFKKFPIPVYYDNMEGLDIQVKQKNKESANRINTFNKKEEEFRKKHNSLMRNIIEDLIQNNARHMKILDRNKNFYDAQGQISSKSHSLQRALSFSLMNKAKKITKQKQLYQQVQQQFQSVNLKSLNKERMRSPYMTNFIPESQQTRNKSRSIIRLRKEEEINAYLQKRKSLNGINSNQSQIQRSVNKAKRQEQASITTQMSSATKRNSKEKSSSIKRKLSVAINDRARQDIDNLLDSQKYIKSRFKNPLNVKYDYDQKIKKKAENLRNQIDTHYVKDYQTIG